MTNSISDNSRPPMTGNEYQTLAIRTMNNQTDFVNVALGLAGEAGEFADHIKKHVFHGHGLDDVHLREELGDQLWYIAVGCKLLGVRLSDVMAENIEKLRKRYPEGFGYAESRNRAEYRTSAEDRQKIQATMATRAGASSVKDGEGLVDAILAGESLFGSAESAQPCTVSVMANGTPESVPVYQDELVQVELLPDWLDAASGEWVTDGRLPSGEITNVERRPVPLDYVACWYDADMDQWSYNRWDGSAWSTATLIDYAKMNGSDDLSYFGGDYAHVGVGDTSQFLSVFPDAADEQRA